VLLRRSGRPSRAGGGPLHDSPHRVLLTPSTSSSTPTSRTTTSGSSRVPRRPTSRRLSAPWDTPPPNSSMTRSIRSWSVLCPGLAPTGSILLPRQPGLPGLHAGVVARLLDHLTTVEGTIAFNDLAIAREARALFAEMNRDWWAGPVEAYSTTSSPTRCARVPARGPEPVRPAVPTTPHVLARSGPPAAPGSPRRSTH